MVDAGPQLVRVRSHGDAEDQVGGRQPDAGPVGRRLRVPALQEPGQQGLPGDLLVAEGRLPLLYVSRRDRAADEPEVAEQPSLDQQHVRQVVRPGRREDLGRALLRPEVVGADDGFQRYALVGAPGRRLADPRQLGLLRQLAAAQHPDEGPDAPVHFLGDLAAELFRRQRSVGGQLLDEPGHHGGGERRGGGQEPLVDRYAAELRPLVASHGFGCGHNPPRESLWCDPETRPPNATILFSGTLLTSW
ncbi:hypothetical protein ACFXJJ_26300 [Streptomyces sp. NPDC059233]